MKRNELDLRFLSDLHSDTNSHLENCMTMRTTTSISGLAIHRVDIVGYEFSTRIAVLYESTQMKRRVNGSGSAERQKTDRNYD